jgi:hypothetical protein
MGRYIQWTDVVNRWPNVPNRVDSKEGQNFYILGAEAEVDAAASVLYTVPFVSINSGGAGIPDLITDVAIDLTYWKVAGWNNEKLAKIMRDDIDRRLNGIKDGTLRLVNSAGALMQNAGPSFAFSSAGNYRSSFGHDNPVNWSPSQALRDDEAAEREQD